MKDSKGREYDGWCMKYPEDWGGEVAFYTFQRTRSQVWDAWTRKMVRGRRAVMRTSRRSGFRVVKVRISEVLE